MAETAQGAEKSEAPLKGARILIVEARFYDDIADALLAGATRVLDEAGAAYDCVTRAGRAGNPAGDRHRARCGAATRGSPMTAWSRSAA